jgi:hypothetical protein
LWRLKAVKPSGLADFVTRPKLLMSMTFAAGNVGDDLSYKALERPGAT